MAGDLSIGQRSRSESLGVGLAAQELPSCPTREAAKIVASKLILDWSPEQISGWLKTEYPEDNSMRVSHETIYRSLFIQARGVLKKELIRHLRSKRRIRRSRHARDRGHHCGRSSTPFPFEKGPQRSKIAPSPAIGRAICSAAPTTVTSRRSWNAIRDLSCWSK